MFIKLIETVTRYYFYLLKIINKYSFIELEIKTIDKEKIGFNYYYYLLNYYLNNNLEYLFNNVFNYQTKYFKTNYYEFIYRENNMVKTSIINGTINDIFMYTRYYKRFDKLMIFMKCNLKVNDNVINIRNIIRRYDTHTKLYDIIYFHFRSEIQNKFHIELQIGKNTYDVSNMNKLLLLEEA